MKSHEYHRRFCLVSCMQRAAKGRSVFRGYDHGGSAVRRFVTDAAGVIEDLIIQQLRFQIQRPKTDCPVICRMPGGLLCYHGKGILRICGSPQ